MCISNHHIGFRVFNYDLMIKYYYFKKAFLKEKVRFSFLPSLHVDLTTDELFSALQMFK